jgi:very-short-patch-repair endonuclease
MAALFGVGERAILEIADRQEGLVSAEQARVGGISRKVVAARIRKGSWRPVHRRVFGVDRREFSSRARILAAVLGCSSPGGVASHLSAGWLWGLLDRCSDVVHLTALGGRNPAALEGVRIHRPRRPPDRLRWRNGIPLTSPIDTLLDLASVLDAGELEAAVAKAIRARLVSPAGLQAALAAAGPRTGIAELRAAAVDPRLTRSGNERTLVSVLRSAELTGFETNVMVQGKEVDVYWPDARLVVEADAYGTHGDPDTYEDDHVLDADFEGAGIAVLRFTARRISTRPHAVVARIAASLALRAGGLPVPPRRH